MVLPSYASFLVLLTREQAACLIFSVLCDSLGYASLAGAQLCDTLKISCKCILWFILNRKIEKSYMLCSPMARGMLTGKLDLKNLPDNDFRKGGHNPQFNEDNLDGVSLSCLHFLFASICCHHRLNVLASPHWFEDAVLARYIRNYTSCVSCLERPQQTICLHQCSL